MKPTAIKNRKGVSRDMADGGKYETIHSRTLIGNSFCGDRMLEITRVIPNIFSGVFAAIFFGCIGACGCL